MNVFEKISAQQKGKENTAVWTVCEQLKDILRAEPEHIEIVNRDLDIAEMSLENAEKKIHEYADKQRKKDAGCVCVPPNVAENIIREFYGIPKKSESAERAKAAAEQEKKTLSRANAELKSEISEMKGCIELAFESTAEKERLQKMVDETKKELDALRESYKAEAEEKEKTAVKKAGEQIRADLEKEYESRINQLTLDSESAERAKAQMEEEYKRRIERLEQDVEKNRKNAELAQNQNMQKFSVYFEQLQEAFNKLTGIIALEERNSGETAKKLKKALNMLCTGFVSQTRSSNDAK